MVDYFKDLKVSKQEQIHCPEFNCNYISNNKTDLMGHINSRHIHYRGFKCHTCNEWFYTQKASHSHQKIQHPESFLKTNGHGTKQSKELGTEEKKYSEEKTREKERERARERDQERERERDRAQRVREREMELEKEKEQEREREKEKERNKDMEDEKNKYCTKKINLLARVSCEERNRFQVDQNRLVLYNLERNVVTIGPLLSANVNHNFEKRPLHGKS